MHHARGLALIRLKQSDAALESLRRAVELEPDRARYAYVYAVGLHSAGRRDEAMTLLKETSARHPNDLDTLRALIGYSNDAGDFSAALEYAERLSKVIPGDNGLLGLIARLKSQINTQAPK